MEKHQEILEAVTFPLMDWFHENARTLPWRSDPTPYHVWLSEIMLQQTRVSAVLGYYDRFLKALPTVEALAEVEEDRLLKLWQGLGYYNRARNLQKAACQIVYEHGGAFPDHYEALLKLAGVGDYTAGAIASIAFGQAVPAVDGNVLRVITRITGDPSDIGKPETKERIRALIQEVMPRDMAGFYNQALMELGALVCIPNGAPDCGNCPVAEFCTAYQQGLTGEIPYKAPKKPRKVESRQVYLIFWQDKVALRRRPAKGLLSRLWEFPNVLSTEKENLLENFSVLSQEDGPTGKHIFTHIEWHMRSVLCEVEQAWLPEGWVWADAEGLREDYAVPGAFAAFVPAVEKRLKKIAFPADKSDETR